MMSEQDKLKNCHVKIEKLSQTDFKGNRSKNDSFSESNTSNESDSSTDCDIPSKSGTANVDDDINTEEDIPPNSSEEENDLPKTPGMENEDMVQITSTEQYEIYLNLVEKDEIFGRTLSEESNLKYTSEKWVELSKTLNNCEGGAKLSPNEWGLRFNRWKSNIKAKCKKVVKSKHRINFSLSLLEKKAISLLWKLPEDQHVIDSYLKKALELSERKPDETETEDTNASDESGKETENKETSTEQYEIYIKAVKEDKISGQSNPQYLNKIWKKLANLLNNCESGPKLSQEEWRKRFTSWKNYVVHKYRKKGNIERASVVLNPIEKKAITFWRRYSVIRMNNKTHSTKEKSIAPLERTSDESGKETENKKTSTEQYEIYFKAVKEDKIIGQRHPEYLNIIWEQLTKLLNNCESGPKLSQNEWRTRFKSWKSFVMSKYQIASMDLTPIEKKGIEFWRRYSIINHRKHPYKKISLELSERKRDVTETEDTSASDESGKETENKETSTEQYEIYFKAVKENKIIGQRHPVYLNRTWKKLTKLLNNCESGPKLSLNEWRKRFKKWKSCVMHKYQISGSMALTPIEKKGIDYWRRYSIINHRKHPYKKKSLELSDRKPDETETEDTSASDESGKETENKETSTEQYEIYFKAVKEDKIIGQRHPEYLNIIWEQLTKLLNNCESGPIFSENEWRTRFRSWKSYVIHKYQIAGSMALTPIEKKGIDFWRRYSIIKHGKHPNKKKSLESSRHKPVVETEDTSGESEKETEPEFQEISTQQYEIYLKLLEEDKIFDTEQQYSTRFKEKWEELRSLLNNCECGPKLSLNEWKLGFNTWKRITMIKYENALKSGRRTSLFLTPIERKAISLWSRSSNKLRSNEGRTMETSRHNRERRISTESSNRAHAMDSDRLHKIIIKTSQEQLEIFLKLVEEDKIFRTEIPQKNDLKYFDKKYAELAKRLNNCKSGPKLSAVRWKARLKAWKSFMKRKYQKITNHKHKNFVLNPVEKKAISLWWRLPEKYLQETSRNVPKETNREDVAHMESEEISLKRKAIDMENSVTTRTDDDTERLSKEIKRWADIKEEKLKFKIAKFKFRNPGFSYDYVGDQPNLRI